MFWNSGGLGWSIGKSDYLTSGSHWHRSGLDTPEPWQGRWQGGVEVTCVTDQEDKEVDQLDSVVQGNLGTTVYLYIVRHCPPVLSNPTTEPSGNLAAGVMSGMVGSTASLAVPCFTVVCNGEVVGSGQVYVRP